MNPEQLRRTLRDGGTLQWDPAVRTAWFTSRGRAHLFVDGTHHDLPAESIGFVRLMGDQRRFAGLELRRWLRTQTSMQLLNQWVDAGLLRCRK